MIGTTPLMGLSRAQPWPYDVRIDGKGYMLAAPIEVRKIPGVDNTAPTSYEYSSRNPLSERTVKFERPYLGIGTHLSTVLESRSSWFAEGVDTSCDGLAFLGPEFTNVATLTGSGQVRQIIEFVVGGVRRLVAISGTRVLYSSDGVTWLVARDLSPQVPLQMCRYYNTTVEYLVIATDTGDMWAWDGATTTTTFTQGAALATDAIVAVATQLPPGTAGSPAAPLFIWGGGTNGVQVGFGQIDSVPAITAAAVYTLPDTAAKITWITVSNDVILIFTERGVWASQMSGQTTPFFSAPRPLYAELATRFGVDNGRNAVPWGTKVYAPMAGMLYEIAATSSASMAPEPVGLERYPDLGVDFGAPTAFAGDEFFGWFTTYDSSNSFLFKYGTRVNPEDSHSQSWDFAPGIHGWLTRFDSKKATAMLVSDIGATSPDKCLYVGFSNGTVERCVIPGRTPFPPASVNCRFRLSGNLYSPKADAGFAADSKILRAVSVFGSVLSATLTATVAYDVDGGAAVAIAGTVTANGQRLEIPDGINGKLFGLKTTLASTLNFYTPVISGVGFHVTERSSAVLGPSFTIRADADTLDRNGQFAYRRVGRTSLNLRNALMTNLAAVGDVVVVLPDGTSQRLAIQTYSEQRTWDGRYVVQIDTTQRALAS